MSDITVALLKAKFAIGIITVSTAAIIFAIVWVISSFTSTAYFQIGMSWADFKRLQPSLDDSARWENFQKNHAAKIGSIEGIELPLSGKKTFVPVYSYTKAEFKNLQDPVSKDPIDFITGIDISYSNKNPMLAQRGVIVMAEYLRDTAILAKYEESMQTMRTKHAVRKTSIKNDILEAGYVLEQLNEKKTAMKKIAATYPGDNGPNIRQVISIADGSEKFLAPTTQLIAIEASIVEKNQLLTKLAREQKMNDAWLSYYSKGIALLEKSNTGAAFLNMLPALKDSLGLDLSDSGLESVFNEITQKNLIATSKFYDEARFLASASVPERKPRLSLTVIVGLIFGFMIGAGYALWVNRESQVKTDPNIPLNNLMLQQG